MSKKVAVTDDGCLSCGNTCTGGCANGCNNTCKGDCRTGCGHACNYSCYPTCAHNCTGDCRTGCGHDCNKTCSPTCAHTCGGGDCKGTCNNTCKNGCGGSCKNGCGGCDSGCSSCTGSCVGGCQEGCSGKCQGTCNSGCGNQCKDGSFKSLSTFKINDLKHIKAEEITYIIDVIKYEASRRDKTLTEITISIGDEIDDSKMKTLIENLKMTNSASNVQIPIEGNPTKKEEFVDIIITNLKSAWNEVIDPEL